jgi:hypothetical protein
MPFYDIHFQVINPATQAVTRTGKFFTFGFPKPVAVQGPQKLFNRWVKMFFTTQNSNPLYPDRGTGFPSLIGSNITQVADLEALMHLYVDNCNDQLQALDNLDNGRFLSDDEKLASASITAFNILPPDGFECFVELRSVSGKRVTALIPGSITGNP